MFSCSKKNKPPLNKRVDNFKISECKRNCGIDSIGFQTKRIDNNLNVKLGYIVNCAWNEAFLKDIIETNDTLIVQFDKPNDDGNYPITECNCFYFFEFTIKDYQKTPKSIRVAELFEEHKFWDERNFENIIEIEETIIEN